MNRQSCDFVKALQLLDGNKRLMLDVVVHCLEALPLHAQVLRSAVAEKDGASAMHAAARIRNLAATVSANELESLASSLNLSTPNYFEKITDDLLPMIVNVVNDLRAYVGENEEAIEGLDDDAR